MSSHPLARRSRRAVLVFTAFALASVCLPAAASALTTETVTMNWTRSGTGSIPPFRGTGSGSFSAVGPVAVDSGTLTLSGQDVAVSSPVRAAARTDRVLTTSDGSTLQLVCFEQATDFSELPIVPFTGSCTITGGTGVFSGTHGHGDFAAAQVDLSTNTVSETLMLLVT
jgi:hypothetical protein